MGAQPKVGPGRMTAEEFVAWAEEQPSGRFELVNGEVVAQASERAAHVRVKARTFNALDRAVRAAGLPCEAFADGMALRVDASTVFEPDAVVGCGPPLPGDARFVAEPVIVVEVLSPSTRGVDSGGKLRGYLALSSVWHYLILDPDDRAVIHHRRGSEDGRIDTRLLRAGERLTLDPPGLTLDVAEMFGVA